MCVSSGPEAHIKCPLQSISGAIARCSRGWKRRKAKLAFCVRSEELEIAGNLLKMTRLSIGKSSIVFPGGETKKINCS